MSNELEAVPDITPDTAPAPPESLGEAGIELWESVTGVFDFSDEPQKLKTLERCCRTADTIAVLEDAAAKEPLVVKGSTGQPVANPLISEARMQTQTLNTLLRALNLPATDEEQAERAERRTRAARTGANARWKRQAGGSVKR